LLDGYFDAFTDFLDAGRRSSLARYLDDGAEVGFLDVYRNGFLRSCTEVLRASYPSVAQLVGDACFKTLARRHVDAHPPRGASLAEYGESFADVIEATHDLHGLAYLGCIARLDRAWTEVYFAADDEGAEPDAVAALSEDAITRQGAELAPRVRLLALEFSALDAWTRLRKGVLRTQASIARAPQNALVWRRGAEIAYRALDVEEHAFIAGIAAGLPIADAAADAFERNPEFDLSAAFASLLAEHMLVLDRTGPHGDLA